MWQRTESGRRVEVTSLTRLAGRGQEPEQPGHRRSLDRVERQLHTVTRTIEETGTRTRVMERRLRAVEQMDPAESVTILALPAAAEGHGEDGDDGEDTGEEVDNELPGAA